MSQRVLKHNPEARMLKEEERALGMDAYKRLPYMERIIYGLYHSEEFSLAEIGEMLDMPESTARNHLHRAQRRLNRRMHSITVAFLAERLQDGDHTAVVQQVIDKIYALPLSGEATAAAATGAVAGAAGQPWWSLAGFLQTIALPFLWVMSLFISGTASGVAFVKNMPTLQARRWLVKHLSICYMGMVILPLAFVMVDWLIRSFFTGFRWTEKVFVLFFSLCFLAVGAYVFRLNKIYKTIDADGDTDQTGSPTYQFLPFKTSIDKCLWTAFGVICLFWIYMFVFEIVVNLFQNGVDWILQTKNMIAAVLILVLTPISLVFHFGVSQTFRSFIDMSKDEAAFDASRMLKQPSSLTEKSSLFRESIFVLPFLCYFLGSNIGHLMMTRTRVFCSISELIVYSLLWLFVILQNVKHPTSRWKNIWTMVLVQFLIFHGLRRLFYG